MRNKKSNKQENKNNFVESWNFIKENKSYIYFAIGFFIFFVLFGYFSNPPEEIELQIFKMIEQIMQKFEGLNVYQTIWVIFTNNLFASFFSIVFGILFGIFPLVVLISNGFILGFIANKVVFQEGIFILWRLFPHGIFELPAILISTGLGIALGLNLFSPEFKKRFKNFMKVFLFIILPALLVAAIIEGVLIFFVK